MNDVLHANIFFYISSVATIVLLLLGATAGYYIILILKDLKEISTKFKKASTDLEEDFTNLRSHIKNQGSKVRGIVDMVLSFVGRGAFEKKKKAKKRPVKDVVE